MAGLIGFTFTYLTSSTNNTFFKILSKKENETWKKSVYIITGDNNSKEAAYYAFLVSHHDKSSFVGIKDANSSIKLYQDNNNVYIKLNPYASIYVICMINSNNLAIEPSDTDVSSLEKIC